MDPVLSAILVFIAKGAGGYLLKRILETIDKELSDALTGEETTSEIIQKASRHFQKNPKQEELVKQALEPIVKTLILPPPGADLTHTDKLSLYLVILNLIVSLTKREKRDYALRGFFNSSTPGELISLFVNRFENLDEAPRLNVSDMHIDVSRGNIQIYVIRQDELNVEWQKINQDIRESLIDGGQYGSLRPQDRIGKERQVSEFLVRQIFADFLTFDYARYRGHKTISTRKDLDGLAQDEREFHSIIDPYAGMVAMLETLSKETQAKFLLPEEAERYRTIVQKIGGLGEDS